jgi:3-(3-hydroxy-phenyl)propionate hydroxylase
LLDAYEVERKPHVTDIMKTAVMLGKVANTHSRIVALVRDFAFRFNLVPPPPPFPAFTEGVIQSDRFGKAGKALGRVPPQGFVEVEGKRQRLDDVVGYRFCLLARANPAEGLNADQSAFLAELNSRLLTLDGDATGGVIALVDADGVYGRFLDEIGAFAILLRPDTNLFGAAPSAAQLGGLVDELRGKLCWLAGKSAARAA